MLRTALPVLCIVALCVGCGIETTTEMTATPANTAEPTSTTTDVTTDTVAETTDAGDKKMDEPIVIDVRSQEEWDEGHIEGAIHIPHDVIGEKIAEHVTDKNATIKFY
jgi:phage shock protein E